MPKLPLKIEKILNEFVEGIKKMLGNHIKKIILYGSYARGDFNDASDIDIMILTDLTDEEIVDERMKVWDYAYDVEFDNHFVVTLSPLLKNIDKFNNRIEVIPFYYNVQNEGVILHG